MDKVVPRFPTLIVSRFITIAATLSFFAGLMLSTLATKDKQEFEFQLQTVKMTRNVKERLIRHD